MDAGLSPQHKNNKKRKRITLPNEIWMVIFEQWHQQHKMFLTEVTQENIDYENALLTLSQKVKRWDCLTGTEYAKIIHEHGLCYRMRSEKCHLCYFQCKHCQQNCKKTEHVFSETKQFGLCCSCYRSLTLPKLL